MSPGRQYRAVLAGADEKAARAAQRTDRVMSLFSMSVLLRE
jgi:hypothetical protein